ncbi:hypothetical protein DPX16_8660 [Anabarilius grahami]|uniref:Uncharacterized protein n=1 Tax=Anabarilius grahami TaxID=495550 RepID=A0A3N0Y937_ANAGA|nr:hypothetical protein DPX16_8660 [Anabarilius grahami]
MDITNKKIPFTETNNRVRYKSEWLGVFPCPPDLKRGDQKRMESQESCRINGQKGTARGPFPNALSRQLQPAEKHVPNTQQLACTSQRSARPDAMTSNRNVIVPNTHTDSVLKHCLCTLLFRRKTPRKCVYQVSKPGTRMNTLS